MSTPVGTTDPVSVFGVEYRHRRLANGDDLYLTPFGEPFGDHLLPDNFWTDAAWFEKNSVRLFGHPRGFAGTRTVFKIRTKPVRDRSLDIVLKWNRMGQEIPVDDESDELASAGFDSPYEEFALVMELRKAQGAAPNRIRTHKPPAIDVPRGRVELWQSGRREHRMGRKLRTHGIELDIFRSYAVIDEWIEGIDAAEACRRGALSEEAMKDLTLQAECELNAKGFRVRDRKPQHIIVRLCAPREVLRDKRGRIPYALVDFELLERTPEQESTVRRSRRHHYLLRQARRFEPPPEPALPSHLHAVNILGVDYVYGADGSTGGALWVVGRDPSLFDYFHLERWEHTPRERLSASEEVYHTMTQDRIHLVWKASKIGQRPEMDPCNPDERKILAYGYNSPFEEVALAIELGNRGMPATYPRAIYMTGRDSTRPDSLRDESRYASHRHLLTPDGAPILRRNRDYVVLWGFWNKPDTLLAQSDGEHYRPLNALNARRQGALREDAYLALMAAIRERLAAAGMEHLNLRGPHILLSLDQAGRLVRDPAGSPEGIICDFDLLRRLPDHADTAGSV